jgi:hypothetical protein
VAIQRSVIDDAVQKPVAAIDVCSAFYARSDKFHRFASFAQRIVVFILTQIARRSADQALFMAGHFLDIPPRRYYNRK